MNVYKPLDYSIFHLKPIFSSFLSVMKKNINTKNHAHLLLCIMNIIFIYGYV